MKIVVTGGAGFIGANLVRQLIRQPWTSDAVVIDDLSSGSLTNLAGLDVPLLIGSVLDPELLDRALAGADAVVHLAAVPSVPRSIGDPMTTHRTNVTGTLEVLEAARRASTPQVIMASSSSVYGDSAELPKREGLRPAPRSPYAVSKLAAESYVLTYSYCYGLPVLAFRFFNVFGPLQPAQHAYAAVVPAFVDAALRHHVLTIYGDGQQTRDFTYVGSVCAVLTEALHRQVSYDEPVNLAFGTRTSLNELISELTAVIGHKLAVKHLPPRPGDVRDSQGDNSRLRGLFPGISPVPLRRGLEETVTWTATSLSHA